MTDEIQFSILNQKGQINDIHENSGLQRSVNRTLFFLGNPDRCQVAGAHVRGCAHILPKLSHNENPRQILVYADVKHEVPIRHL